MIVWPAVKSNGWVANFLIYFHFLVHLILIKSFKSEFSNLFYKLKFYHCIFICTFLLYCGTGTYLFSLDEESCYVFSIRSNFCDFLASDGTTLLSDHKSIRLNRISLHHTPRLFEDHSRGVIFLVTNRVQCCFIFSVLMETELIDWSSRMNKLCTFVMLQMALLPRNMM